MLQREGVGQIVTLLYRFPEPAGAIADPLLGYQGLRVTQALLGAVAGHQVARYVAAHAFGHQAADRENFLWIPGQLQGLLPTDERARDAVADRLPLVTHLGDKSPLCQLLMGPAKSLFYLGGVLIVSERNL